MHCPPLPQCTSVPSESDDECDCLACTCISTPRNLARVVLGLVHTREFYAHPDTDEFDAAQCRAAHFLPFPAMLGEWKSMHPRGYAVWKSLALDCFDRLILRLLHDCCSIESQDLRFCTCVGEELVLQLTEYHLEHAPLRDDERGPDWSDAEAGIFARLPSHAHDVDPTQMSQVFERMYEDVDVLFMWPTTRDHRDRCARWPTTNPTLLVDPVLVPSLTNHQEDHGILDICSMRFPLDFLEPSDVRRVHHEARRQHAAFRLQRAWRRACCDPTFALARDCLEYAWSASESTVLGKRVRPPDVCVQ